MGSQHHTQVGILSLIKEAFRYYPKSFSAGFVAIFIAALLQVAYYSSSYLELLGQLKWAVFSVVVLLAVYFWSVAICAIGRRIAINARGVKHSFALSLRQYPRVLIFVVIYVATYIIMSLWLRVLTDWGSAYPQVARYQGMLNLFLAGLPLLVLLLLFLLALPLIITEQLGLVQAFKQSICLVWRSRFAATFVIFVGLMLLFYLVMPGTQHAAWLAKWHLQSVFVFLVYLLLGPLLINYLVLLLRRLRQP